MNEGSSWPLGPTVESTPALWPAADRLDGRTCHVGLLATDRHGDDLFHSLAARERDWAYSAQGPFVDRPAFDGWLAEHARSQDSRAYVVVDRATGAAVGIAVLMAIRPEARVIEVGSIVFSPKLQRTTASTEAHYLLARYVFESLRYRRCEWKCNALNAASRYAAERLGFTFEGIFRQHMIVKGRNRDTAWYAMLDGEWPRRRAAFERWLDPTNFRDDGSQIVRLSILQNREAG